MCLSVHKYVQLYVYMCAACVMHHGDIEVFQFFSSKAKIQKYLLCKRQPVDLLPNMSLASD